MGSKASIICTCGKNRFNGEDHSGCRLVKKDKSRSASSYKGMSKNGQDYILRYVSLMESNPTQFC